IKFSTLIWQRLGFLVCLICVASATTSIDPRGARPVEPSTRSDKCATQKEWPFCTTDDWGSKCPSGCRIQGLLDKNDHSLLKRIEKIRSLLDQNAAKHRSTDAGSKQTYDYIREKLILDSGSSNNYYDLAQTLRQRITDMKIKIDRQMRTLAAMKDRVRDQVAEMQKLEVDIDIKLRSCKGSCAKYSEHQVDRDSYVTLDKQIQQLDSQSAQSIESVGTLYVMKSRPLKDIVVDTHYKSKDLDDPVKTMNLILEEEGSSSSPATISKVPGTSFSSSSSSSTQSASCTKSIRVTTVQTDQGPVDRVEEVIEGGPECQAIAGTGKGGTSSITELGGGGDLFGPGGFDSKTAFMDPFASDFGAFMTDTVEDDVPDFQARSMVATRVQRQADYVGKDCMAAFQHHLHGEKSGLFQIKPVGAAAPLRVYCHQEGLMGGWLLIQQRDGGALSFNRTWAEYRRGFGSVDGLGKGEFWLGNLHLYLLTNQSETLLKVEVEDWEGGVASAEYVVRVGTEEEGFPLWVSGYVGDAGDGLTSHSGMKFSTFDRDADRWAGNCAAAYGGGWWYDGCQTANLNGVYHHGGKTPPQAHNGVVWTTWKRSDNGLKTVRMFIRPNTL
uniref:Fibrinogen alpha chain n=1 Tax=Salarias fasciatus TaxID=181472 RepID=A0A672HJZ9_SALFA